MKRVNTTILKYWSNLFFANYFTSSVGPYGSSTLLLHFQQKETTFVQTQKQHSCQLMYDLNI